MNVVVWVTVVIVVANAAIAAALVIKYAKEQRSRRDEDQLESLVHQFEQLSQAA